MQAKNTAKANHEIVKALIMAYVRWFPNVSIHQVESDLGVNEETIDVKSAIKSLLQSKELTIDDKGGLVRTDLIEGMHD